MGSLHFRMTNITDRQMHAISVLPLAVSWAKLENNGKYDTNS